MMSALLSPAVLGIVAVVVVLIIAVSIVVKRYRIVEPDTAMIVVGNRGKSVQNAQGQNVIDLSGQKVVTGGGTFVWPFVQRHFELSLRSRRLTLTTTGQTKNGITLSAQAVAVIKVGGSEEMIRAAAQRFLSQQDEIETSAQEVLSGSLRSILGNLTVLEIIQDRQAVASLVLSAAEEALSKQGLVIDTLQIQEIKDNVDYISNLGRPESAAVRRNAEVADTEANRAAEEARIAAEKLVIEAERELELQKANIKSQTDKALAEAEAAKPLEEAQQKQRIVEQEALTAQRKADLQEQELNASVRKVADAEAYRIKTVASANAEAAVITAEADRREREFNAQALEREALANAEALAAQGRAEAGILEARGKAEALAAEAKGIAEAKSLAEIGKAEALATEAKGLAEAKTIEARAEALAAEGEAVLVQQMIEIMPEVAGRFAEAYGNSNMTIISADGAQSVGRDMVGNMTTMNQMMKDAVGIDISSIINGRVTGEAIGDSLGKAKGGRSRSREKSSVPQVSVAELYPLAEKASVVTTLETPPVTPVTRVDPVAVTTPVAKTEAKTAPQVQKKAKTPVVATAPAVATKAEPVTPAAPQVVKDSKAAEQAYEKTALRKDMLKLLTNVKTLDGQATDLDLAEFQGKLSEILNGVEFALERATKAGIDYNTIPMVSDPVRANVRNVIRRYTDAVTEAGYDITQEQLLANYPLIKAFVLK